ncbi:MAG: hypothetical protein GQ574_14995 [Crocinitomix sp.]|nr:hypothetical protein [Crocinitomix sp.]
MEIFFDHIITLPKPFPDVKIHISTEEVILRKTKIPTNQITGYAYGNVQIKMGPIKGGVLFALKIFYGNGKSKYFELNRSQMVGHEEVVDGIIQGLWQVKGRYVIKGIITGIKSGHEVALNRKKSIIVYPTGIGHKSLALWSSKITIIEWENLKTKVANGAIEIGDNRKKGFSISYPLKDTENIHSLIELFTWKADYFKDVADLSKIK